MRWLAVSIWIALVAIVQALSSKGSRVLVVLEEAEKTKYSTFWSDLESRGYHLKFEGPKSENVALFEHGELAHDHVMLFPIKAKAYGAKLSPQKLVEYMDNGGNIVVGLSGSSGTPSTISSFLAEFDVTLPPGRNSLVVDHFNYDTKTGAEKHDVLVVPSPKAIKRSGIDYFDVGQFLAVPKAVGHLLGNTNPLLTPILNAPDTAYTYDPTEEQSVIEELFAAGSQLSLVTAFQARNSARMTIIGAIEMFQDEWMSASARVQTSTGSEAIAANRVFATRVTKWTFHEIGVLKVGRVEHYLEPGQDKSAHNYSSHGPELNPEIYRIKNDVHFLIELSEYKDDHLIPFIPRDTDTVQLEFSMLSPFHRLNLVPSSKTANSTLFTTSFRLPDQHGVFNFLVNYKRSLLTNVYEKRTVTVRHFAHDEWPRSFVISAAYPWISGIGVTIVGWVFFVGVWLYSAPHPAGSATVASGKKIQ